MAFEVDKIKRVYFVGIGGIGMSALARYFKLLGMEVAGYDSTETPLTQALVSEGISIHYSDSINLIPKEYTQHKDNTLIVYTPAVPNSHAELSYFNQNGFNVVKRAKALGIIASARTTVAVAGTHGKTSTSTLLAHILSATPQGCDAFLGGISKNFSSNLVLNNREANRLIVEADEFDRSFLNLSPQVAIITSIDPDHLDIYKNFEGVKEAFRSFVSNITEGGALIIKKGIADMPTQRPNVKTYTYSATCDADFCATNIQHNNGLYQFDLKTPFGVVENIKLGVLGRYNVENAVAASAVAIIWGIDHETLREAHASFKGIARRFDLQYLGKKTVYIDDYAHHPEELKAAIGSTREMYPNRRITGVFQPHLYSRTNDLANEFAQSLSLLDNLIILDIYPAREEPIPGVTSELILNKVTCGKKQLCDLNNVLNALLNTDLDILLTLGAGSIDRLVKPIVQMLKEREEA